jgi:aryl-alcohol dehydrogenase-like predicted oxidoreductase
VSTARACRTRHRLFLPWETNKVQLKFSRLGLGTVQWGMTYGVANVAGRPRQEEIERMLKLAADHEVNWLDTARAYGESEEVIGRALRKTGLQDRFLVVTKICHIDPAATGSPALVRKLVRESIAASRKALGLEVLPMLLIHKGEDLFVPGVWDELLEHRSRGTVTCLGVSVSQDPVKMVERALCIDGVEALQVAVNVFDQRLVRSGVLERAALRGVTVFARSVYLQGLIPMPEERVPVHLAGALPLKRMLLDSARSWGRSVPEVAIQFVLGLKGVTAAVVGCETESQVAENLSLAHSPPLDKEQMDVLLEMPGAPLDVIEPWRWSGSTKPTDATPSGGSPVSHIIHDPSGKGKAAGGGVLRGGRG